MEKKEIRKEILKIRSKLTCDYVEKNSKIIQDELLKRPEYISSEEIYIYISFNNEVRTDEIIQDALLKGKKVAVPKIIDNIMEFYYIKSLSETKKGFYGTLEAETKELANKEDVLVIVPGVVYDKKHNRIGHGGGYYDKYLTHHSVGRKIALAYSFQVLEDIPYNDYDIPVDIIITQKGTY